MAVSRFGFRSISLPSRVKPINATKIEPQLQKLKSCQTSKYLSQTLPINSQTIQSDLHLLLKLFASLEEAAKSPATQQRQSMEELLECSVELLDSCGILRVLVLAIKESIRALQSAVRRKGSDSSVQGDITSYACIRKRVNKSIAKTLKTLKNLENKNGSELSLRRTDEGFIRVFREVAGSTIAIFKCILQFLSCPTATPRSRNMVLRLLATTADDNITSEVGSVNFAIRTLQGRIRNNVARVDDAQILHRNLQNLDVCIQGIESGLERLFRSLVRSRVAVLNLLTNNIS